MGEIRLRSGYVLEKMERGILRLYWIHPQEKQNIVASADCYLAEYQGEHYYWLRDLRVYHDHRKRGLGRYLIHTMREDCAGFPIRGVIDPGVEEDALSFEELQHFYQRCDASITRNRLYWPAFPTQKRDGC